MTSSNPPSGNSTMLPREITLIVAATNQMGIGINNSLPWKGLKKEMAYFARITKRASPGKINALIMGRKTWDSIPPKFRPLKDRTNIIVSRASTSSTTTSSPTSSHTVNSISEGIKYAISNNNEKIFIIGGAEIYKAALEMKEAKRILLTRFKSEFECDAFFPLGLEEDGVGDGGWIRSSEGGWRSWTGEEEGSGGEQVEGDTRYEFEMWEKVEG